MFCYATCGRVREDHWGGARIHGSLHGFGRNMRNVDEHAEAIHLTDHFATKLAQAM